MWIPFPTGSTRYPFIQLKHTPSVSSSHMSVKGKHVEEKKGRCFAFFGCFKTAGKKKKVAADTWCCADHFLELPSEMALYGQDFSFKLWTCHCCGSRRWYSERQSPRTPRWIWWRFSLTDCHPSIQEYINMCLCLMIGVEISRGRFRPLLFRSSISSWFDKRWELTQIWTNLHEVMLWRILVRLQNIEINLDLHEEGRGHWPSFPDRPSRRTPRNL